MPLKMINDYVLVLLDEAPENTTNSGIVLTKVEIPCSGVVISVGKGKHDSKGQLIEHDLEVGDKIIFGKSALNTTIEDEGVTYYVMHIEEVFGKKHE